MKDHYIDEVNVVIDGDKTELVRITGMGAYNPNRVKNHALKLVRESYPDSKLACVILSHKQVTVEEYRKMLGSNPPWFDLGGNRNE